MKKSVKIPPGTKIVNGDNVAEMTVEQRKEAFIQAQNALVEKYGMIVQGELMPRMVGPQLQAEVMLGVQPVPGWKAKPNIKEGIENGNKPDTKRNVTDD